MNSLELHETIELMQRHPGYSDIQVFVETGTAKAGTILHMPAQFEECHTIEASEKVYKLISGVYKDTRIDFYLGESPTVLKQELPHISLPAVFYLDAHWYKSQGGENVYDKQKMPLLDELEVIYPREQADLIVINDARLLGKQKNEIDWRHVTLERILETIGKETLCDHLVENDRLVLYRNPGPREDKELEPQGNPVQQHLIVVDDNALEMIQKKLDMTLDTIPWSKKDEG